MIFNPNIEENYKQLYLNEIELVRKAIDGLSSEERSLIMQAEFMIDNNLRTLIEEKETEKGVRRLNIFHLRKDIPGDVMKYLIMLYQAGGYYVSSHGDFFSPSERSSTESWNCYPNQLSVLFYKRK